MSGSSGTPKPNPFPGLRPFREEEGFLFFGRESQVDAMVDSLARSHLLAVVGTSGSGKSSLVNCGLRPALHRGFMTSAGSSWRIASLRPAGNPLRALARALAEEGVLFNGYQETGLSLEEIVEPTLRMSKLGILDIYQQAQLGEDVNLLVVVDQFEELFRYRGLSASVAGAAPRVSEEAIAFVNLLLEVRATRLPIYVALTMRSDYLGDCAEFPGLPEAINDGQYLVPRMTRDERRSAIAGPAAVSAAEIHPVLLTRLVNDAGDNPDQLSILQHALSRTWACWEMHGGEGPLMPDHYAEIGTMAHALDQHAEQAYAELEDQRSRAIAERLFKTLTDKGTDPRGIRRPTKLAALCELADAQPEEVAAMIDVFRHPGRSFLMPPAGEPLDGDTVVDISHESLMRVWTRLRRWADEEADSTKTYQRLVESAALHEAGKASLWRDPELQLAIEWRRKERPTAAWAARFDSRFPLAMDFLDKSQGRRDAERRRERRKRIRTVMVLVSVAFITAILSLLYASRQRTDANRQRGSVLTEKEGFVLDFLYGENPTEALAYAIQITGQSQALYGEVPSSIAAVLNSSVEWAREKAVVAPPFESDSETEASRERAGGAVKQELVVAMAQDGTVVSRFPGDRRLRFFGLDGMAKVRAPDAAVSDIHLDPDARTLLAMSDDGETIVTSGVDSLDFWTRAGRPVGSIRPEKVEVIALSSDGSRVATAGDRGIHVWTVTSSERYLSFEVPGNVEALALDPHGRILAASSGTEVVVWDLVGKNELGILQGHEHTVHALAIDPNGRFLASGNGITQLRPEPVFHGEVRIWNLRTLDPIRSLPLKAEFVRALAFTPDGQSLIVGADKRIEIWNVNGQQIGPALRGHAAPINFVGVAAEDPTTIVSASRDGTLRYWDAPVEPSVRILRHQKPLHLNWAALAPGVSSLATVGTGGVATFWALDGENPKTELEISKKNLMTIGFDADGVAVAAGNGFWVLDRSEIKSYVAREATIWALDFTPDGRFIITGDDEGELLKWDRSYQKILAKVGDHEGTIWSLDIRFDGREIVSGATDGTVRIWNLITSSPVGKPLSGHEGPVSTVKYLQQDGQAIVSGGHDGTLRIWGRDGEQRLAFKAHQGSIISIDVSSDGRFLASGGSDGVLRIWFPNGDLVGQFLAHEGMISSVEFGTAALDAQVPQQVLLSGSWDGTARLWPDRLWATEWESSLRSACTRLRHHRLLRKPTSSVAVDACLTCEEYVWEKVVCSEAIAEAEVSPTNNLWNPSESTRTSRSGGGFR